MKKNKVGKKLRGYDKLSRIPIKIVPTINPIKKPNWIKVKLPFTSKISNLKNMLRKKKLYTVCEEASCPNLGECFSSGIATFMIMGDICTRRCSFCDVAHGKPNPLDINEPYNIAVSVKQMKLKHVVITSVDRDDLKDGGAEHFIKCIKEIRKINKNIKVEILVPDFRGKMDKALKFLITEPSDIFNHNLETVRSLYKQARPGSDYDWSLKLLKKHKELLPNIPTKSGIMLGLGETKKEIIHVLHDLKNNNVDMITIGQYLQPSKYHIPVKEYIHPDEFNNLKKIAEEMGFLNVASGPMVRSSYHAEEQTIKK